jgi:arginine-tRNA-protein transferase
MKHAPVQGARFFFATAPMPCPYLPGRIERRLVTELVGRKAIAFHDTLSQAGFRRSHCIAYVPVCRDCDACTAVRIVVDRFRRSRGHRRVWARNRDIAVVNTPPRATEEQYALFRAYQEHRHRNGEMANMDFYDYQTLVEDTPVDTTMLEFRDENARLVAGCLTDRLSDGLSAVYSFFDPGLPQRSLGTQMILWLIEEARASATPYVYLGYWIADCAKMSYKRRFEPLEAYTADGWRSVGDDQAISGDFASAGRS